jgi:hypothetical protein
VEAAEASTCKDPTEEADKLPPFPFEMIPFATDLLGPRSKHPRSRSCPLEFHCQKKLECTFTDLIFDTERERETRRVNSKLLGAALTTLI